MNTASVGAALLCLILSGSVAAAQQPGPAAPSPEVAAYTALRELKLSGECARVTNIRLERDAGVFTLKSGEIYFVAPVEGRITAAVFLGDGEFSMTPPLECERKSLAIFTKTPAITEPFTEMVLRFTDETWAELKESEQAAFSTSGPQASRAADVLRDHQTYLREKLGLNFELRTFTDLYTNEKERHGYFTAFIKGRTFSRLAFLLDPRGIDQVAPEQVVLASFDDATGGLWASFPMKSSDAGGPLADSRSFDIRQHDIDATINDTMLTATDRVTIRAVRSGVRVLPFQLFPRLRISRVTDGAGTPLPFIQQPKEEGSDVGVLVPAPLPRDAETVIVFEYSGNEAISDSGGGNYILLPRSTWYPNNGGTAFGDRALFRTTFHVPDKMTIVGTGALAEPETTANGMTVSKWTSGSVELAVTGFNVGRFKRQDQNDTEAGYTIEFYANKVIPNELKELQIRIDQAEAAGIKTDTTLGSISTTGMAKGALADAMNATRIYNAYFGKLPYTRIAISQQPAGFFGQAWPTLVYMPFTAFLDTTTRAQIFGVRGGTNSFFQYVGPHEVAHQWWGHVIGWESYRDQWMSEGFAEFSASLWVQHVRGIEKFNEFWEAHRKEIVQSSQATEGKPPYTIGPVTQGFRLSSGRTGGAYRYLVYPKGAYILHMLRMMMYDPQTGDAAFQAMMKDLIQTHFNTDVSTEEFHAIVARHVTKTMNLDGKGRLDWFFDQWVYGTEVPTYAFEYSFREEGGKPVLVGKLIQSGVSDTFRMQVPVYLDFGKGWSRLGTMPVTGNTTREFAVPLPQKPKRATINAMNDVLYVNQTVSAK